MTFLCRDGFSFSRISRSTLLELRCGFELFYFTDVYRRYIIITPGTPLHNHFQVKSGICDDDHTLIATNSTLQ